jgi:hypothetical protein
VALPDTSSDDVWAFPDDEEEEDDADDNDDVDADADADGDGDGDVGFSPRRGSGGAASFTFLARAPAPAAPARRGSGAGGSNAAHSPSAAATGSGSSAAAAAAAAADASAAAAAAPSSSAPPPRNAPGMLPPIPGRRCANCNAQSTPLWRNGPFGAKTLCNACGVRDNRLKVRLPCVRALCDTRYAQRVRRMRGKRKCAKTRCTFVPIAPHSLLRGRIGSFLLTWRVACV